MKKCFYLLLVLSASQSGLSQCVDLFFSEYIEGSSSNRALEIYNPTDTVVDLNNYILYRYNNGSVTPTDSLLLYGMIDSNGVYVIANPNANGAILAQADTLHTITFFNGDDALALVNTVTGDTLDIIGEIGVDPGSGWPVGSGATNNNTLIRKFGVQQGETDWVIGATSWDVYPIDMADSLGFHNMTPCGGGPITVSFFGNMTLVDEGVGHVDIEVIINDPYQLDSTAVDLILNLASTA